MLFKERTIRKMESKIEITEQEAKENYNRFLRVSAEFENYKKRFAREMNDVKKFSNESLIKEMLSVVDNLELALTSSQRTNTGLVEGINITLKGLLNILKKSNVEVIVSLGKPFDPVFHQAVIQKETNNYPKNTVTEEMQKGYTMCGRLIRPSMVAVSTSKQ